jgi:hypothetical protein
MIVLKIFELEQFYNRWKAKQNSYLSEDLKDLFDKFFTAFVIFNRIYNVVEVVLNESGDLDKLKDLGLIDKKRKKVLDNQASTVCIAFYLRDKSAQIISDLATETTILKQIIESERFYIDLYYGKPQKAKDLELLHGLISRDTFEQLKSLLLILYNLRCNLFHGEKGYYPDQTEILKPSINCLTKINDVLINKLKTDN